MSNRMSPPALGPRQASRDRAGAREWDPAILDDLHALLAGLEMQDDDTLEADLRELEQNHGDVVYAELLYLLSHLRFPSDEAKPHWERILGHRRSMHETLGAPVDLRVALISYFLEVNRKLKNPKVIEMQLFEQERASAYRDELTGLYNYRLFREHLTREMSRTGRCGKPLSLVMIDVDHFKQYNDANGHEPGNKALAAVATLLKGELRKSDIAARYGGEEFVLILPSTPKTAAHRVAERIREAIEQHRFEGEEALPGGGLTVSIGLATYPADASGSETLVRHADRALYLAKSAGRNQVVLYGQSRRSYGRVDVQMPGTFRTVSDQSHTLTTVNISEAGILFRTDFKLRAGSLLEMTLQTDHDREIRASGHVVHVENAGDGTYRTAVHIIGARNADRARLMKLVRESTPGEFPPTGAPPLDPLS